MRQFFCTTVLLSFLQVFVADELRPAFSGEQPQNAPQPGVSGTNTKLPEHKPPSEPIPSGDTLTADSSTDPATKVAEQNKATAWKPRLLISLDIQADGTSGIQPREVTSLVPVYTENNGRRELSYRSVVKTYATQNPGQAVLVCDEVDISVAPAETGAMSYNVECAGRARFVLSGMIVTCDSFSLKEGTATCRNATIQSGNVRAKSESLELSLDVAGIKTRRFDQPAESLMAIPAPFPSPKQFDDAPAYSPDSNRSRPRYSFRPPQERNFEVDTGTPPADTPTGTGNNQSPPSASNSDYPRSSGNFEPNRQDQPAPVFQRS